MRGYTIQSRKTSQGDVRHRVSIRFQGRYYGSRTFSRKTDAQAWARGRVAEIERGETVLSKRHSLHELIDTFVAERLVERSPKDRRAVERQLRWWQRLLGPCDLVEVTPQMISQARQRLSEGETPSGKPASSATQNRYVAALSAAFSLAVRWEWIRRNPVKLIDSRRESIGRIRWLSQSERMALLEEAHVIDRRLYLYLIIGLNTGARLGELQKLRRSDVNVERQLLTFWDTKNRGFRTVPIAGKAFEALKVWIDETSPPDKILGGRRGKASFPKRQFYRAREAAGLGDDVTFHVLRHTAATLAAMAGTSQYQMMAWFGWSSPVMPNRYIHLAGEHLRGMGEELAAQNELAFLDGVSRPPSAG